MSTVDYQRNGSVSLDVLVQRNEERQRNQNDDVLYSLTDVPPHGVSALVGLQHFLLTIGAMISFPLMLFELLCIDDSPEGNLSKTKITSSFFLLTGIVTFSQYTFGVRLPMAQVISMAYFIPITTILSSEKWECPARIENVSTVDINWTSTESYLYLDNNGEYVGSNEMWQRRMREVQGGIIIVALLQVIIGATGVMSLAMRFIGPLTIAPCLILVSVSLSNLAIRYASMHWGIALVDIAIIILFQYLQGTLVPIPFFNFRKKVCSVKKKPLFAMFPFLFALLFTWLLCHILTITDVLPSDKNIKAHRARTDLMTSVIYDSPWFYVAYPFRWGWPTFSVSIPVALLSSLFVGIVDSVCDYYACSKIVNHSFIPQHALNRGITVEGLGILLHGIIGTGNSTSTFGTNVVAIGMTKVHSGRVMQTMAIYSIICAVFTKLCSVLVTLPLPIIGGNLCAVGGIIFSLGVGTASYADLSKMRNMFVLGFSVFFAIVLQTFTKKHQKSIDVGNEQVNDILRAILGTGMLIASFIACILDNTMPGTQESRGIIKWKHGEMGSDEGGSSDNSVFNLPFKTDWNWTRKFPICPRFDEVQEKKEDEDF